MRRFILVALGVLAARMVSAQVVATNGYIVGSISLPATAQGDVEVVGTSIVVGQGSFGAGSETVVRRDADGTITTLATGFNSLGSFALSPQADLLFVTDNGGDLSGAVTGDTVFAIDSPDSAAVPVIAAGHEVAAPGTLPFAQGLAVAPDGEVYASDASGGTSGSVLKHRSFLVPPFVTLANGFGYTAGLAFTPEGRLFVGDVDATTFAGRVVELDASGAIINTLASSLSGAFDQAFDRGGDLLVSGGFTAGFGSSTIVSIDPSGVVSELAHGFAFSGGLTVDPVSGRVYALDAGSDEITTLTPINALVPGGGAKSTDCFAEISDAPAFINSRGRATLVSICRDGDNCDRDGVADGTCTFGVGVCFNVGGDARCMPAGVESFAVLPPRSGAVDSELAALATAATALMPSLNAQCVGPFPVHVATRLIGTTRRPGTKVMRTLTTHAPPGLRAQRDRDTFTLRCLP